jgi:hypothetical protein
MNHDPINRYAAFRASSEERRKEAPMIRKTLLAASAAALMSTPAWALPSQASTHATGHGPSTTPVGPPSTTPNNVDNPGKGHGNSNKSGTSGTHGKSHKCKPHSVGFIVSGTFVSQTLTLNSDGTYSGELKVNVTHTNHHAVGEKEEKVTVEKTYPLTKVRVAFGLADTNADGSVALDDLKVGDRVMLIGKVTKLAKKCDHSKFTAQKTIRKVVFNDPATV